MEGGWGCKLIYPSGPQRIGFAFLDTGVRAGTAVPGHRETHSLLGSAGTVLPSFLEEPGVRMDPRAASKMFHLSSPSSLLGLSMCIAEFGYNSSLHGVHTRQEGPRDGGDHRL